MVFYQTSFGHIKVSVLDGGLKKWIKENKNTTKKIEKIKIADSYRVSENPKLIKNKKHIDENIKNLTFQIVDARSRNRFEGKIDEPRAGLRKGCIIGSKNIPYLECINSQTNTFKEKSKLEEIFKKNNVDTNKPIVFTCGSGMTACVLGMAYSLISDKNAVIYDGSWSEYGKK